MIRIDFYVLQAGAHLDRERLVCRLANKAFEQGQPLYIHAAASEEAERLDDLLWTFRDISFLPHQLLHEGYIPDVPIFIGCGDAPPEAVKLMINLAHPAPSFLDRFERVIEVVGHEPDRRQQARERYRYYQNRDCSINTHNITFYHE
jgi:DNA polymerase III subunit chi